MTQQNSNSSGTPPAQRPRFGSANQNSGQQGNSSQPQPSSFGSRPSSSGSRFGQATPTPPPGRRPANPFQANRRAWTVQPLFRTVVRFDLRGLGDPFYRLLDDMTMNPDYGNRQALVEALEAGSVQVDALTQKLDALWAGYGFSGAFLMTPFNPRTWDSIARPAIQEQSGADDDDTYEDEESDTAQNKKPQKPLFHIVRAIDPGLVLNVLARSRKQLLIAKAPLVYSRQYLNRTIMSDDPRLVALTHATGFMNEGG